MTRPATRLVLATHNAAKVDELRQILDGLDVELLSADDVDLPDVEETGDTFAANALLKARAAADATGLPAVADDSGLVVDGLGGEPGIYSARYAGRNGVDTTGMDRAAIDVANLELVRSRAAALPSADRPARARFVCAAALALPGGGHEIVEATMEGVLTDPPRGEGGFGYDPIFLPDGHDRTSAELTAAEKHAISHRGRAFRALRTPIAEAVG